MIFSVLELMREIPFCEVIIHSTVLAPDGRRMSKSLGNGIDPLELIEEYGADARATASQDGVRAERAPVRPAQWRRAGAREQALERVPG